MINENDDAYQYNRCSSRGICSINPATASLQEIILIYLKCAAYYGLKSEECEVHDKRIRNLVLNTISVLSSNYEISEINFDMINSAFKKELPAIINDIKKVCSVKEFTEANNILNTGADLKDYIRYGEREFNRRLKNVSLQERSLYRVLFVLVKSLCINILIYESFGKESDEEVLSIYRVLNLLNTPEVDREQIIKNIYDISEKDCHMMTRIREVQEECYGEQEEREISFSTKKGKALLVVGSNLRELEQILNIFKEKDIDVYTHDNMILAHTFPGFEKYKNLKGQFGHGMENCLLDFSTFPGPIIFTRHSLFNVENLYRGILYTTDFSYSKGVIQIKNNDFAEVVKSVEGSKGFKTGKICDSEKAGFSYIKIMAKIKEKTEKEKYDRIVLIGLGGYLPEEKEYFQTFIKHAPQNVLIISLFYCESKENVICIHAKNDIYGMNRLFDGVLKTFSRKITLFFPYADRHTLSDVIHLSKKYEAKIYVGSWNQSVMKPDIADSLKITFGINIATTPKNDLNNITDVK